MSAVEAAPVLTMLERLTPRGWESQGTFNLLHPERYPERCWDNRGIGRATTLDDRLQPVETFRSSEWPHWTMAETKAALVPDPVRPNCWRLPDPDLVCEYCTEEHPKPHNGSCLL